MKPLPRAVILEIELSKRFCLHCVRKAFVKKRSLVPGQNFEDIFIDDVLMFLAYKLFCLLIYERTMPVAVYRQKNIADAVEYIEILVVGPFKIFLRFSFFCIVFDNQKNLVFPA